jgi:hypothetical protein
MAQPLQTITISAPGFFGINTQDSPIGLNPAFASIADNCVIDQYGRIGARKGYAYVTTNSTPLGTSAGVEALHEHIEANGTSKFFSGGNNKIFTGTTSLTDVTPAAYTITANNWKIVSFNNAVYFFQHDYEPLVYQESTGTVVKMSSVSGAAGTPPEGNEGIAAYGRLWVANLPSDKSTVYWSDLLLGSKWNTGSAGSINVSEYWPTGYDEIVALAAHNGFLYIFGRNSILIYSGANDPATMVLQDAVSNIGCIARDSVQNTGGDIIFLSAQGVMSLGRVIQEKSTPIKDISKNVRTDLTSLIPLETGNIKSLYSPEEAFYIITFPINNVTYCFDMRAPLQDGSHRATTWTGIEPLAMVRRRNGVIYFGHPLGISQYTGYLDNNATYLMRYFSIPLDFGNAANLKFLKTFTITLIGGSNAQTTLSWSYDYEYNYQQRTFSFGGGDLAEYNVDEYNIAEYTPGILIRRPSVQGSGSGTVVTVGVQSIMNGSLISIQKIDILALIGRLI